MLNDIVHTIIPPCGGSLYRTSITKYDQIVHVHCAEKRAGKLWKTWIRHPPAAAVGHDTGPEGEKSVLCLVSAQFGGVIGRQVIYTYLVIIVLFWTLSAEEVGYFNDCQRGHLFWHI